MDGWAKIPEAARYAGMKPRSFREWLREGLKHSRLPSGTILIRYSDIDSFLEKFRVNEDQVESLVAATLKELTE